MYSRIKDWLIPINAKREKRIKMKPGSGFTLLEILFVILLIALITTVTIPFSMGYLKRQKEKKEIVELITNIGNLKKKAISYLQLAEITADKNSLILLLNHRVIKKFTTAHPVRIENPITFNRNGICNGGEICLQYSNGYTIRIEKVSGIISLEKE